MYIPTQGSLNQYNDIINEFGGLNRNVSIAENEFSDMANMSSDDYPLLSSRRKRAEVKSFETVIADVDYVKTEMTRYTPLAFVSRGSLAYVAVDALEKHSFDVFIGDQKNGIGEKHTTFASIEDESANRQIVAMGAYLVVFPDKYYVNTNDLSDCGYLEVHKELKPESSTKLMLTPCTVDGTAYDSKNVSKTEPEKKENGTVWVDTSGSTTIYKIWDASSKQWSQVATTYIKVEYPTGFQGFSKWDGISISGLKEDLFRDVNDKAVGDRVAKQISALNQSGVIVYEATDDYIIIAGILDKAVSGSIAKGMERSFKFDRNVPEMDFVIESNNRLWGCHYGLDSNGKVVNEIYACKQGDFKNWNCFLGISTDSYVMSVGSEGMFTGAVTYNGYPTFFKENEIHKVYGNAPSSYQLMTTTCRGVGRNKSNSIACVNNILYYATASDIVAYDGSLPWSISKKLGRVRFKNVIAGAQGDKVYFCCHKQDGSRELLVYDTACELWHKEDCPDIQAFAADGHVLYYLEKYVTSEYVNKYGVIQHDFERFRIKSVNDDYNTVFKGDEEVYPVFENRVSWYAQSGDIGYQNIYNQYVSKIIVRAKVGSNAFFRVLISYDGKEFEQCMTSQSKKGIYASDFTITPKRCDYFQIRIEGEGKVEIISIAKSYIRGSDKH